ncbi:MAG: M60 family metallopeptidase, partial [Bacteroidaceae bacterium]|nr:M60 family metallopeptidase [Bacteroidaceae bacterium]
MNVQTAGTLSSLISTSDKELKVTGFINGSDIKFIRQLINSGKVTILDWSEVSIVAGGEAYYESYTTADNTIGEKMFYQCSKLQAIELPTSLTIIGGSAFDNSGLKSITIPDRVRIIGHDAFGGCSQLATVVIGKRVNKMEKGVFYGSAVTKAYVKPLTPPTPPPYMFSSKPSIYVYREAMVDYKQSDWKDYGAIYGTLDRFYPQEPDEDDAIRELCTTYFEDAACTQLKAEYQQVSDEEIIENVRLKIEELRGEAMDDATFNLQFSMFNNTLLKIKNDTWAAYEKDFRIHDYKPYSDAQYWNEKMMSSGGSYMGNPTGIYTESFDSQLYVFVDDDIPSDASLYIDCSEENHIISAAKTGKKLVKGLNIIDGTKNALYYILYTANTKSMAKTLSEWPSIKIHIEGGVVNGYYDVSRHSDADYRAILNAATLNRFTVKGGHSLYHLKTATFKSVFPNSIDKSIAWFDSVAVWQKNLMGMTEEVASGKKAGYPWYLTGGEAIYPLYYNNPNFAIEGDGEAYAHSSAYHTSYNSEYCIKTSLNALNPEMDDWCAGHECGHNNQQAISLEGGTEVANNLFSNLVRYLGGLNTSVGSPLSTVMEEFARHEPFYFREVDSQLRMYWNLYLYYHLGQRNTSFYPELFKALRTDKLVLSNGYNNNNGGLKFVRKVCEIAGEDLTDFFTIWGFFEPVAKTTVDGHPIGVTTSGINTTKDNIAQYEKKNREIIFVEDRADYVLSTGFLQAEGKKRRDSDRVGQCGDLGQFWDYWPEALTTSEYTYLNSDSLYAFEGTGGVGLLMLDSDNNIKYAANAKN